jgi:hypothetical protein
MAASPAICLFLFQLANASILPLAGERLLEAEGRTSSLVMSALIDGGARSIPGRSG